MALIGVTDVSALSREVLLNDGEGHFQERFIHASK
jgi:hypothetical protein